MKIYNTESCLQVHLLCHAKRKQHLYNLHNIIDVTWRHDIVDVTYQKISSESSIKVLECCPKMKDALQQLNKLSSWALGSAAGSFMPLHCMCCKRYMSIDSPGICRHAHLEVIGICR